MMGKKRWVPRWGGEEAGAKHGGIAMEEEER
jgi:hypothetical protein